MESTTTTHTSSLKKFMLPLRITQLVFAIITLGLSAYITHATSKSYYVDDGFSDYYYGGHTFGAVSFNVFASLFTILSEVYFIGSLFLFAPTSPLAHPLFSLILDGLNWVFWLSGFASVAALFGGLVAPGGVWGALIAFGVLLWLLFSATLALNVLAFLKSFKNKGATTTNGTVAHTQDTPMTNMDHPQTAPAPVMHQGV